MAFPLPRGITPSEIEFISEMEMVTVVPRQRLDGLDLLSVSSPKKKAETPQSKTPRREICELRIPRSHSGIHVFF